MKLRSLIPLVALLLAASVASAKSTVVLTGAQEEYRLGPGLEYLEDQGGALEIEDLSSPAVAGRFAAYDRYPFSAGFTRSAYWFRFTVRNNSGQPFWVLGVDLAILYSVELFEPAPDGRNWVRKRAGYLLPFSDREFAVPGIAFRLDLPPGRDRTVYLRVRTGTSMTVPLTIHSPEDFAADTAEKNRFTGFISGALLIIICQHLILFLMFRDRVYLDFVLFLIAALVLSISNAGFDKQYLWPNLSSEYLRPGNSAVLLPLGLLFAQNFLRTKVQVPRLHRALSYFIWAGLGCAVLTQFSRRHGAELLFVLLWPSCLLVVWGVFRVWRQGPRASRHFILPWIPVIITGIYSVTVDIGVAPRAPWYGREFELSVAMLGVLWSLALGDRFNEIRQAKERAQAQFLNEQQESLRQKDALTAELEQANQELRRYRDVLTIVAAAQSRIISSGKPGKLFDQLLMSFLHLTESQAGAIAELDDRTGSVRVQACLPAPQGEPDSQRGDAGDRFSQFLARLAKCGQVTIANPNSPDFRTVEAGLGERYGSFASIPLCHGDRRLGIIVLGDRPGGYDLKVVEFLQPLLGVCAMAIDAVRVVRDREEASAELRRSDERNRELVENAPYGIYQCDADGRFLYVNPALVGMLSYNSAAELMLRGTDHALYRVPSQREELLERMRQEGTADTADMEWERRDGQAITVRIKARSLPGQPGVPPRFEMVVEDVTRQRQLEKHLDQTAKMEAVGRLAGGIAHDFNNLLTVILGYVEMLEDELMGEASKVSQLDEIRAAAEKAQGLTAQLLAFSRHQQLRTEVVNLNDLVTDCMRMLQRLIGEHIEINTDLDSGLLAVKADPVKMQQVLVNLTVNARDAMPGGGRVTLRTENVTLAQPQMHGLLTVPAGSYVALTVSDAGCGMDKATAARIFEPFFTTKELGRGTGLGLSIVYGVVKQSGGYIWVDSEPERGAAFTIWLPAVSGAATPRNPRLLRTAERATEPATILLVEDEQGIRSMISSFLQRRGYRVLAAVDGADALRVADEHGHPIDVLLTDVVMPNMTGPQVAKKLSLRYPNMKIIYMSGYSEQEVMTDLLSTPTPDFLPKPVSLKTLATRVQMMLSRSARP